MIFDEEREEERINALPRALRDQWQPDGMSAPPEAEAKPFTFHGKAVPSHTMAALNRYLVHGLPPGHFLTACLENNFIEAVCRADAENIEALAAIAAYIYHEIPSAAWGSPDRVRTWLAKKELDRESR